MTDREKILVQYGILIALYGEDSQEAQTFATLAR